jgi:hypothetical protein
VTCLCLKKSLKVHSSDEKNPENLCGSDRFRKPEKIPAGPDCQQQAGHEFSAEHKGYGIFIKNEVAGFKPVLR